MMRKTNKKALYELIDRARTKTTYEQLHTQDTTDVPSANNVSGPSVFRWVRKPRFVQFNAGRIEFSMPLPVSIAVLLGVILVIVVTFRAGQWLGIKNAGVAVTVKEQIPAKQAPKTVEAVASKPAAAKAASTGKNRIVIQMYQVRSHLEPVKDYFAKLGVETEILEKNNWYYLVTKNKYDNVDKPGTDGHSAKLKIIELGSGYKAPQGNETFGTKPFSGAFGMKFDE
jgi:hypothetical protein